MRIGKLDASIYLWKLLLLLGLFCLGIVGSLSAQPESLTDVIRQRIDMLLTTGNITVAEARIASTTLMPYLYEKKHFAPLWTDGEKIEAMIKAIGAIEEEGLEPEDYHYSKILGLQAYLERHDESEALIRADLDMLLTDALILLENHLVFGKVDPQQLDPNWNFNRRIDDRDAASAVERLLSMHDLKAGLDALKPQRPIYAKLKTALARFRSIAAAGGWQPLLFEGPLEKGTEDDRVLPLRERFKAAGYLSVPKLENRRFDDDLKNAVIQFQRRHGLTSDGVVGPKTIAALNVTVEARIDQIRANLERARWILHTLPDRFVLVDIAGFHIYLFDADKVIWSSRIQVGTAYRMTPVFRDDISYLEFNPAWTLPPTIVRQDILPSLRKDPEFAANHRISVLDHQGRPLEPSAINWRQSFGRGIPYTFRQAPGPDNALGLIKFMFPNTHMVYLHDMPSKSLFNAGSRTFSSGCIRVEKPFELAGLLLNDPQNWNPSKFQEIITSGKTQAVYLTSPVPILLLYWTVDVENNGIVYFKKDIYGRDPAVIKGLKATLGKNAE